MCSSSLDQHVWHTEQDSTGKWPFVPVQNRHLYPVLNQYEPSGTNMVEHLYRAEPRPGTNVPSTGRRGRGVFVLGGGTTRYKCFFFCFMFFL
jgi:hypothetical protein